MSNFILNYTDARRSIDMTKPVNEAIQKHYTRPNLGRVILEALENAGKDIDHLSPKDLAPIDEFHI